MAPFTVTALNATIVLAQSSVAATLLDGLRSMGIVGLAMIPGEPRQILSALSSDRP